MDQGSDLNLVLPGAGAFSAVFDQEGELSAATEVRRLFPGITDNAKAGRGAP
jgi:hypothetical protein